MPLLEGGLDVVDGMGPSATRALATRRPGITMRAVTISVLRRAARGAPKRRARAAWAGSKQMARTEAQAISTRKGSMIRKKSQPRSRTAP
jgi:hypothetical protein